MHRELTPPAPAAAGLVDLDQVQTASGPKWLEVLTEMQTDLDDAPANHPERAVYEVLVGQRG